MARHDPVRIPQTEIDRLLELRKPGETAAMLAAKEYEEAHPDQRVTGCTSGMSGFYLLVRDVHPGEVKSSG